MKIGWLYKRWDDSDDWTFSETEPEFGYEKRQIVYAEVIE